MQLATHASEHLEKRKLNQLAPISCLYSEIFSIIFSQVRDSIIAGSNPSSRLWAWHHPKEWIGFTHVCHAWRDIAINTPTLWTKVFVSVEDNLEWVQELLRRSKQCPLSILVSKPPESALSASGAIDPILQELKNDMHRFRELKLLDIPIDDLLNFFSNSHTHRLEYLHIISYRTFSDTSSNSSSSDTPSAARFTLNDNILRVDSLRRLSIENCGLDFYSPFLLSLTHLELFDIDDDCRLPCIEFVAMLAAIPGLERLQLQEFLIEDEVRRAEEYVAMTNKTQLHLKYLDLSCRLLGEMVQFLCTLILPSTCELSLRISHDGPEIAPGFQLITSWLSNHFQPAPSLRSLQSHLGSWCIEDIDSYNVTDLRVVGSYDSEGGGIDKAHLSASVLLRHDSESEAELIENLWVSFLKSLPLSDIVSFEAAGDVTLPDSVWLAVFAPLTTLNTIIIHSDYYAEFFRIASPSSIIAQPFPALSSVAVKADCVEDHLSIARSLDLRLQSGLAPLNLVLYTDIIQPHAITRLRESALNVQIHPMDQLSDISI